MTRLEEIDAQISELTKKRNEEQAKIDEVMRKEAEEKQRKLVAEKGKRKKEVQEAYDKYMELSNKYDLDYCSNVRMYDFPFNFFEL
jgi:seryl-tRNA synthetase